MNAPFDLTRFRISLVKNLVVSKFYQVSFYTAKVSVEVWSVGRFFRFSLVEYAFTEVFSLRSCPCLAVSTHTVSITVFLEK